MSDQYIHPDFVIQVAGQDVTKLCYAWRLVDVEDGMSTLQVSVRNPDMQLSGFASIDSTVQISFGYAGNLGGKVKMKIKEVTEGYNTDSPNDIIVVGMDCTEKLQSSTLAGNYKPEVEHKDAIKHLIESAGLKANVKEGKIKWSKKTKRYRYHAHNKRPDHYLQYLIDACQDQSSSGSGERPIKKQFAVKPPEKSSMTVQPGARVAGPQRLSKEAITEGMAAVDENRLNQLTNEAASLEIQGTLRLIGQPNLKAKKCLTIQNVGPQASGKWYVTSVQQEWTESHGYWTLAQLLRQASGKDGGKQPQPIIWYADIYQGDTINVEPRDIDGGSQASFTYGDGKLVHGFHWGVRVQPSKGAGEEAFMEALKHDDPGKLIDEKVQDKKQGDPPAGD